MTPGRRVRAPTFVVLVTGADGDGIHIRGARVRCLRPQDEMSAPGLRSQEGIGTSLWAFTFLHRFRPVQTYKEHEFNGYGHIQERTERPVKGVD